MRILIVEDGWGSYVLPAVRSLGRAGWTVGLGGPRRSRSATSRWVSRCHEVPSPEDGLDPFTAAVQTAVEEGGYDVVFGGDDVEVLALSAVRDRIGALVPYAGHSAVLRSIDKLELTRAGASAGVPVPRTVAADDPGLHDLALPVVVKARLHWTPGASGGTGRLPARLCRTWPAVSEAVREVTAAGGTAVVQQVVDGDLMAVTALCAPGGRVVAESHQAATRTSPRLRTSTRARTTPVDPELSAVVGRLLADLGWLGIANLQFLRPTDGVPRLIDLNGRFYGSLVLAVSAGLDLPVEWVRLASVGAPAPSGRVLGRAGVRYQALEEDLRRARVERRGGLAADLLDTLHAATRSVHSTWDPADPRPSLDRVVRLLSERGARTRAARFTEPDV